MRNLVFAAALGLAACTAPGGGPMTTSTLAAADAATSLAVGQSVTQETSTRPAAEGMDPVVTLTLRHSDGRSMVFQQANHTENDLRAQAPGGPLAQIMGLFGEESPTLYHATPAANRGAAFLCASSGPTSIGVYQTPDGAVQIVGLNQHIEFETLQDGTVAALPYSPDQVCARLSFTRR